VQDRTSYPALPISISPTVSGFKPQRERGPWSAGEAVPAEPHPEHQQDASA
jgi:hypothetical protein